MPDRDRLSRVSDLTGGGVVIRPLPQSRQWSLRARKAYIQQASDAWRAPLGLEPLASSSLEGRHALRLGPDEWLLLAESALAVDGLKVLAQEVPLSLVDISDREVAWEIAGDDPARALAAGCPLDLSDIGFPQGRATRTVYGHAEVVLWRPGAERIWQMRALRSFTTYLTRHLAHVISNL